MNAEFFNPLKIGQIMRDDSTGTGPYSQFQHDIVFRILQNRSPKIKDLIGFRKRGNIAQKPEDFGFIKPLSYLRSI